MTFALSIGLALLLALFPPTAPWSERILLPLFAFWSAHQLQHWRPVSAGVFLWGLGDLGYTAYDLGFLPDRLHTPYLLGYLGLGWGLFKLPGKTPRRTLWFLLPAFLLASFSLLSARRFLDGLYPVLDLLLLLLLSRHLEELLEKPQSLNSFFFSLGLALLTLADLAHATLDLPGGSPFHFTQVLGYALLGYWSSPKETPEGPILALAGTFLLPILLGLDNPPPLLHSAAGYFGFLGALTLLFLERTRFQLAEKARLRWDSALGKLARLFPRASQILNPEAVLVGILDAVREVFPEAQGLEVISRRELVGQRTPHAVSLPLDPKEQAYLYFASPPEGPGLDSLLALAAERLRQLLAQIDWGTLALTDQLTGLLNRRGLELQLPKLVALAMRYAKPLSVVMLDLDHFKRINDTFGHPIGDEVLRMVGRTIQNFLRTEDLSVRYGGEEFLLVLFNTNLQGAQEVVERIRTMVRKNRVPPIPWPLTLSGGIAGGRTPQDLAEVEGWIYQADFALLKAKESGRNRVVLAESNGV